MKKYVLGIDIGGTKTEVLLSLITKKSESKGELSFNLDQKDWGFEAIHSQRIPTNRLNGYEKYIENLANLIQEVVTSQKLKLEDIAAFGAGIPGSVNPQSGKMIKGNSMVFEDKNILEDVAKKLNLNNPVLSIDNDANLFAFAEVMMGAGVEHSKKVKKTTEQLIGVGIILGTGVGGGIIINAQPLVGARGGGGEIGHTNHIPNGRSCYCGSRGCVEQYLSGPALEGSFHARMYSQIEKRPNSQEIFEMAANGEPLSIAVTKEYKQELAKFIAQLSNNFDPDFLVLGGGLSNQETLYDGLSEMTSPLCFLPNTTVHIYKNSLGDSAGVYGAALRAFQKGISLNE